MLVECVRPIFKYTMMLAMSVNTPRSPRRVPRKVLKTRAMIEVT